MIEINEITKSFNGKQVLKGITSTFQKGETNMIIGGSGTGKSVLLKTMIGLVKPDSGHVLYNGRDFYNGDKDTQQSIRREMGVLFQGGALFDSKTVEENVRFPLDMLTDQSHEEKRERVAFCLQRVGLEAAAKRMPSEISGGMKKRVGIARAISMQPKYLFVDEPNSGLDPKTSILIDELIAELTQEYSITTVVVTHDMNSVMGIGEHILFLHQGQKWWEGSNKEIAHTDNKELNDFVFASKFMQAAKDKI